MGSFDNMADCVDRSEIVALWREFSPVIPWVPLITWLTIWTDRDMKTVLSCETLSSFDPMAHCVEGSII